MVPQATWGVGNPAQRVEYSCAGEPAVVEYEWGKGHVVWWASSTPLENGSLARAHDLDLLLSSLGPREGHHFYWDESLHGDVKSEWSYASGPSLTLLWIGLAGMAVLVVFSFSRRAGPIRDLPQPARAAPIEYLQALGSLYKNAGAASTAVTIAWERFRRQALRLCGQRGSQASPAGLAAMLHRRFRGLDAGLEEDLQACEAAVDDEKLKPRAALKLIQTLAMRQEQLRAAASAGAAIKSVAEDQNSRQERAS